MDLGCRTDKCDRFDWPCRKCMELIPLEDVIQAVDRMMKP